jgi:hypothetical protein
VPRWKWAEYHIARSRICRSRKRSMRGTSAAPRSIVSAWPGATSAWRRRLPIRRVRRPRHGRARQGEIPCRPANAQPTDHRPRQLDAWQPCGRGMGLSPGEGTCVLTIRRAPGGVPQGFNAAKAGLQRRGALLGLGGRGAHPARRPRLPGGDTPPRPAGAATPMKAGVKEAEKKEP